MPEPVPCARLRWWGCSACRPASVRSLGFLPFRSKADRLSFPRVDLGVLKLNQSTNSPPSVEWKRTRAPLENPSVWPSLRPHRTNIHLVHLATTVESSLNRLLTTCQLAAMATEDARYRLSTQYRLWSFSPSKLAELREQTNSLAKTNITSRLVETKRVDLDAAESMPEFLTPPEETQLLKFFTVELIRAADFCGLPTEVRATATVFLRRFYVTNSIMTYPPQDILKTCLFFGSKAEGLYTRLAKLADKFPNTTEEEILAGEFLLCQGVRFAFDVRHPFRALEGAILELRRHADLEVCCESRVRTLQFCALF